MDVQLYDLGQDSPIQIDLAQLIRAKYSKKIPQDASELSSREE